MPSKLSEILEQHITGHDNGNGQFYFTLEGAEQAIEKLIYEQCKEVVRQVTYQVTTRGTQCTIKATLPAGFTMREFTRIFDLRHAKDYDMTDEEYILWNQEQLKINLMERINGIKDRRFSLPETTR